MRKKNKNIFIEKPKVDLNTYFIFYILNL